MPTVTLLGPQRLRPTIGPTLKSLRIRGGVAIVTAGWEEREAEDDELKAHLPKGSVNLQLWERCERIFALDPPLFRAFRGRRDRQAALHELYRRRLRHAIDAVAELARLDADADLLAPEREAAVQAVRDLDARHLERMGEIDAEFVERFQPARRAAVAKHRRDVLRLLDGCDAVVMTGGHVRVLLNRLRLFDLDDALDARPIVAWSAGAMAMSERVVLFHDQPPQGPGNAEALLAGLGRIPGVLPFPNARRRLNLADPQRVALLARRFDGFTCMPMDEGTRVDWDGRRLSARGMKRMTAEGRVVRVPPPRRRARPTRRNPP